MYITVLLTLKYRYSLFAITSIFSSWRTETSILDDSKTSKSKDTVLIILQVPQPCKPWNGVLDGTRPSKICVQRDYFSRTLIGEEDCLYLNIHILEKPGDSNVLKPVMVFIHGGGFEAGSGDEYSAEYLIEYNVILVTINYRLHVFGFLNLGLPECPGNVGLKDQLFALKWIKENIRAFGGDENNITIFGESAGSASVYYMMLSPMAKGSFHKAIAQSGHPFAPWAFSEEPLKRAFELGVQAGYSGDLTDRKSLLEFLKKIPAEDLTNCQKKLYRKQLITNVYFELLFVPSVEFDIERSQAFLPESPELLMTNIMPVPLLTGLNDLEGLVFLLGDLGSKLEEFLSEINKTSYVHYFIPKKWLNIPGVKSKVGNKIKEFYFNGSKVLTKAHLKEFIELISDINFNTHVYDIPRTIKQKDSSVPVYIYRFNYEGELNSLKMLCTVAIPDCQLKGSCHADELPYLFKVKKMAGISPEAIDRETNMIDTLCRLWTNFAKYGNPTPSPFEIEWKSHQLEEPYYMNINHLLKLEKGLVFEDSLRFWDSLAREVESYKKSTMLKL